MVSITSTIGWFGATYSTRSMALFTDLMMSTWPVGFR
jgi:hypothetical protein